MKVAATASARRNCSGSKNTSCRSSKSASSTPEEAGKKKAFRLGDKVEVKIQADYYFGGAVGGGTVEVLVYQNPFYHHWSPPREYPWFYEDARAA